MTTPTEEISRDGLTRSVRKDDSIPMTHRENLITILNGGVPEVTPFSAYENFLEDMTRIDDAARQRVVDMGLLTVSHINTVEAIRHGTESTMTERMENGHRITVEEWKTPVGTVAQKWVDGWHTESFVKQPEDYRILQWITEHTELKPWYDAYHRKEEELGERGLPIATGSRTPAMKINVDLAGTEQFCLDVAMEVEELLSLYEAMTKLFRQETEILAAGPGRFVKWFENLTISMIGPRRYENLLVSVYNDVVPLLDAADKRVMVHYDGDLNVIRDQIATAPFHMIESLTEPPEGDMTYDQCRAAWPDKVFWGNVNIEVYELPPDRLREEIRAKRERAGKRGFAFEISEDLPANWPETVPIILETLQELG